MLEWIGPRTGPIELEREMLAMLANVVKLVVKA
jgi:hypothetical protein